MTLAVAYSVFKVLDLVRRRKKRLLAVSTLEAFPASLGPPPKGCIPPTPDVGSTRDTLTVLPKVAICSG